MQLALIAARSTTRCSRITADIGLRHARKHLGWALDAAAETAGAPADALKAHRERVLTPKSRAPCVIGWPRRFDDFAGPEQAAA